MSYTPVIRSKYHNVLLVSASILLGGFLLPFIFLEAVCRFLPVSDRVDIMPVNASHPYLHFKPIQTYSLTQGNLFQIQARKQTNNEGFFCDQDLLPNDSSPRVAVIGDSFVEAVQVENSETIHARLDSLLPREWKVFGIGSSGSALPQYLAYARYAMYRLKPKALVFVIYQNDFTESLVGKSAIAGHHYFTRDGRLIRLDRQADPWWKLALFKSAFFRYLWLNVKLPRFFSSNSIQGKSRTSKVDEQTVIVTRYFLTQLKQIAGDTPVWIITDAPRPAVYSSHWEKISISHPVAMKYAHLRKEALRFGFQTVDLAPVFRHDYLIHRQRFEFPTDGHWNTRGHSVAADALAASIIKNMQPSFFSLSNTLDIPGFSNK
jgi:hypothetical protein